MEDKYILNKVLNNIVSKTIGFDLTSVEAMSDEDTKKWLAENAKRYEENRPKVWQIKIGDEVLEVRDGDAPPENYTPTTDEIKRCHEIIYGHCEEGVRQRALELMLNEFTYRKKGKYILPSTPSWMWGTLRGREYIVDMEKGTCVCIAMS